MMLDCFLKVYPSSTQSQVLKWVGELICSWTNHFWLEYFQLRQRFL